VDILTAVLVILVVIAILFEVARRAGVPYPSLFVLGGPGSCSSSCHWRGRRLIAPAWTRSRALGPNGRPISPCWIASSPAFEIGPNTSPPAIPMRPPSATRMRLEHEEIQHGVIAAQREAVIELRDRREINDATLRAIERKLDLEEIRMEG
jgi:hypothetical protein